MRIAKVEGHWVSLPIDVSKQHVSDFGRGTTFDALIVRIETDGGIVGIGEGKNAAGSSGSYAALAHLVNDEMGPYLLDQDPRRIGRIWESLYSGSRAGHALKRGHAFPEIGRRGLSIAAISAIDIALWDILGKSLGVAVSSLLGGRKADQMPAYGSGGWAAAETIGAQLAEYIERSGFGALKMRVGAMDGSIVESADRVKAARAAIGYEVELMCDAHGTLTPAEAKRLCYLIRDCDLTWFEEPVSPDDKAGLEEVRHFTHVPIAAGESESTRFEFRELVDRRAVDVLQPDLGFCGGITEAWRIAALAATYNLELSPHMWAGAPAFAAGLHVAAASASSRIIEYPLGANPMLRDLIEESFTVEDGMIAIPDSPGLGITIREDVLREFSILDRR